MISKHDKFHVTYTLFSSSLEINLICTDTEAADSQQVLCMLQDLLGELGL